MHFVHLFTLWTGSWLGTLISYYTIKWLWETKPVLYDYKLNQCFAFFILCVFSGGGTDRSTFLIHVLFHSRMIIWLKKKKKNPSRTITHCFLSLNCTIWAPFLILKMHMCDVFLVVFYIVALSGGSRFPVSVPTWPRLNLYPSPPVLFSKMDA